MSQPPDPRPELVMHCDVPGCLRLVARAPRVIVPSATPFAFGHRPMRVMTTLHYCEPHAEAQPVTAADILRPKLKGDIEARAKVARPDGFKPDFERASIEWVLVTTPEYKSFLQTLGIKRVFTA